MQTSIDAKLTQLRDAIADWDNAVHAKLDAERDIAGALAAAFPSGSTIKWVYSGDQVHTGTVHQHTDRGTVVVTRTETGARFGVTAKMVMAAYSGRVEESST